MANDIKRGEIRYVELTKSQKNVQYGGRLCCIVQNDIGNANSPTTIIVPLTSQNKHKLPTHYFVEDGKLPKKSIFLCEQIMTVNKENVRSDIVYKLTELEQNELDKAIKISLGL